MSSKTIVVKRAVRPANHIAPLPAKKKVVKKSNSDPVVQCWRVLQPIRVADRDSENTHMRQYGDYVPEAGSWKNIGTYLRTQHIEIAYVNKSELEAALDDMYERFEREDAEKSAEEDKAQKKAELMRQLRELEAEDDSNRRLSRPANSHVEPEQTRVEKIDLGGLPKQAGIPQKISIPRVREIVEDEVPAHFKPRPTKGRTVRKV